MATKEELFEAVRLIKEHCESVDWCRDCPLSYDKGRLCLLYKSAPYDWPDPEEGGSDSEQQSASL